MQKKIYAVRRGRTPHRHFLPSRRGLNRLLDTSLGENYIDYVSCISPQTFAFYSLYSQFSTYSAP